MGTIGGAGISDTEDANLSKKRFLRKTVRISGKQYHEISASGTTSKDSLIALLIANDPTLDGITAEEIEVIVRCVGGGGGGAWGGTTGYGGFPGAVVTETRMLSDFPDGNFAITVGAGSNPGAYGGGTQFGPDGHPATVHAPGGARGGNNDTEEKLIHSRQLGLLGLSHGLWADATNTASSWAPPSFRGPGKGGAHHASRPLAGGTAAYGNVASRVDGPTTAGADGLPATNALDGGWDSFGSGAAGSPSAIGGDGGYPGGGGGGGQTGSAVSKGRGGNGCIRLMFKVTIAI